MLILPLSACVDATGPSNATVTVPVGVFLMGSNASPVSPVESRLPAPTADTVTATAGMSQEEKWLHMQDEVQTLKAQVKGREVVIQKMTMHLACKIEDLKTQCLKSLEITHQECLKEQETFEWNETDETVVAVLTILAGIGLGVAVGFNIRCKGPVFASQNYF